MSKSERGRLRKWWQAVTATAAAGAGTGVRLMPGVLGPVLVAYGLWLAWAPLGFVALGACLIVADRRIP